MKKITINSENRRFNISSIAIGCLEENKAEKIEFEIPKEYQNYGKKACFSANGTTFAKLFDNITSNILTITRDISQYSELDLSIEFFKAENEDEIIARTSILHIVIENAVVCEDVKPDDEKVVILNELIEKVTNLDNQVTKNEEERQKNEQNRIQSENQRQEYIEDLKKQVENGDFNGKDAMINGVNTLNIIAGENIGLEQKANVLTISNTYDDSELKKDVLSNKTNIDKNSQEITDVKENYSLITETGNKISLTIDSSTYVMTLQLKDKNGSVLSTGTIDLPLETMVVGASYNADTQEIELTLKNGSKVSFSVSDLVKGLVNEDDLNDTLQDYALKTSIPTKLSQLKNDSGFSNSINISNLDESIIKNNYNAEILSEFNIGGFVQKSNIGFRFEVNNEIKNRCFVIFEINDKILIDYSYFKVNNSNVVFTGAIYESGYENYLITDFTNINNGYFFNRNLINQIRIYLIFKKNNDDNFTDEEINSLKLSFYYNKQIYINNFLNVKNKKLIGSFEVGGVSSADGSLVYKTIRCRSKQINFNEKSGERVIFIDNMPNNSKVKHIVAYNYGKFYKTLKIVTEYYSSKNYIIIKNKDDNFNSIIISLEKYGDELDFTEDEVNKIKYIKIKEFENDLEDKEWAGLGDSITYGFIPRNYTGYPGQLLSYLPLTCAKMGMTAKNYGISGSTIAYHSTRNPMCVRYSEMTDDADIITVMGGTNDIRNGIQLGTINDNTNETFYGALKILAQGLYDKYYINQGTEKGKNKHIIFFTPLKLLKNSSNTIGGTGTNYDLEPWCNAIKEVAKMFGFPVIDLQNISQLNPALSQNIQGNTETYTGTYNPYMTDGTHPTQEGHEILASIIKNYIQNL